MFIQVDRAREGGRSSSFSSTCAPACIKEYFLQSNGCVLPKAHNTLWPSGPTRLLAAALIAVYRLRLRGEAENPNEKRRLRCITHLATFVEQDMPGVSHLIRCRRSVAGACCALFLPNRSCWDALGCRCRHISGGLGQTTAVRRNSKAPRRERQRRRRQQCSRTCSPSKGLEHVAQRTRTNTRSVRGVS